jgi:hypothetical protein
MTVLLIALWVLGMPMTYMHVKSFGGWENTFIEYAALLIWPLWAVLVTIVIIFKLDK